MSECMEEEFIDIGEDGQVVGGTVVADLDEGDEGEVFDFHYFVQVEENGT